jgi:hypothetical protein
MFDPRPDIMQRRKYKISTKLFTSELFPWTEMVSDAVVVIDAHEYVVYLNDFAKKLFLENQYDRNIVLPCVNQYQKDDVCTYNSINGLKYLSGNTFEKDGFQFFVFKDFTGDNKLRSAIKKQRNFFDRLLGNLPFGFFHCQFVSKNHIELLGINESFKKHVGMNAQDSISDLPLKLGELDSNFIEIIEDIISEKGQNTSFVKQMGLQSFISFRVFKAGENEVVFLTEDITNQVLNEKARKSSEQRLMLAQRATSDALVDFNLETSEFYLSPRFYAMLDYQENVLSPH